MSDLLVIVPSRGRPGNARRLSKAFAQTCTAGTRLVFVVDDDDPTAGDYPSDGCEIRSGGPWQPMVPKLNAAAVALAGEAFALAFMGDDHLPRTPGWDALMLDALHELGTGVVYGDDLLQRERLCTAWAMTSDIVRALGAMVPAPVGHMYCDNAVMALARSAECLRYLPDVVIEHMHPIAGKAAPDEGYVRVNRPEQYRRDEAIFGGWLARDMAVDAAKVRALLASRPEGGL
jgi:hypothetical protein